MLADEVSALSCCSIRLSDLSETLHSLALSHSNATIEKGMARRNIGNIVRREAFAPVEPKTAVTRGKPTRTVLSDVRSRFMKPEHRILAVRRSDLEGLSVDISIAPNHFNVSELKRNTEITMRSCAIRVQTQAAESISQFSF